MFYLKKNYTKICHATVHKSILLMQSSCFLTKRHLNLLLPPESSWIYTFSRGLTAMDTHLSLYLKWTNTCPMKVGHVRDKRKPFWHLQLGRTHACKGKKKKFLKLKKKIKKIMNCKCRQTSMSGVMWCRATSLKYNESGLLRAKAALILMR